MPDFEASGEYAPKTGKELGNNSQTARKGGSPGLIHITSTEKVNV
jgi:hypothetical protein